jgi:hypothetical protein
MTRRVHSAVAWLLLCGLLLVHLPLLSPSAAAQKRLPVSQHEKVIQVVASHLASGVELPDNLLKRCGFQPPAGAEAWARFPPSDKIETAYHVAEGANPGEGGEVWLALGSEPLLRRLVSAGKVDCPSFKTSKPAYRSNLSARDRAIIAKLASYCGAGAMGYIADTAARALNVDFRTARETFTRHGYDVETGLLALFEMVPREQLIAKKRALFDRVASRYEGARYDELLSELNESPAPRPTATPRAVETPVAVAAAPTMPRPSLLAVQQTITVKGLTVVDGGSLFATFEQPVNVNRPRRTKTRAPKPAETRLVVTAAPTLQRTDWVIVSDDSLAWPANSGGLTVQPAATLPPSLQNHGVIAPAEPALGSYNIGSYTPGSYTRGTDSPTLVFPDGLGLGSAALGIPRTGLGVTRDPAGVGRLSPPAPLNVRPAPASEPLTFRLQNEPEPLNFRLWSVRTPAPTGLDVRDVVGDFLRERAINNMLTRRANEAANRSRALDALRQVTPPDCDRPKPR